MKKVITSVVVLFMVVATLQAQEEKTVPRKIKQHHVTPELNFSEDQKQKLKSYNEDFRKQMAELRKNENITVKEYRDKMELLRKSHQAQVKGLFTMEQKNLIEKNRSERNVKQEEKIRGGLERMKTHMGLSDDQTRKIIENRKSMAERLKSIRENETLDRTEKGEELKGLMEKRKAEMKSILTEEQLQKMKELRKNQEKKRFHRQPI